MRRWQRKCEENKEIHGGDAARKCEGDKEMAKEMRRK